MKRISVRKGLVVAIAGALVVASCAGVEVLLKDTDTSGVGRIIASFFCFGFLIGVSVVFDDDPSEHQAGRPILRILFGSLAGLCLGLLWEWPHEGTILCTLVAAGLGYAGSSWAKHF
jgi:hypothetical protein